ncbi:abscisic acid and environmental stress-inducible protein-like [Pseudomyrmex gracilis]|uniref:abscisic acid and environmental stress-inducible protein-like n=1 Tax=Pseudomyrmex gracilis TaxID=219809 RepID=UPI000994EA7A|nr:abscisic acid and environmental stress-inducible protein-like [Pseudomyrmex gracilis]XP_020300684.1 abscisic acid and environmental stress-inducible protein-like [Pseudomyrmex gracilis]
MSSLLLNLLLIVSLICLAKAGGGHGGHKHVIIHVPYKIKTIHHTHTITKHIHHGGGDKYEVLGYTVGHPIDLGGHGGGGHDFGGGGHDFGGGGHDFGGGGGYGGGGGHDFGGGGGGGGHDFGGGDEGGYGGGGGHEDWGR